MDLPIKEEPESKSGRGDGTIWPPSPGLTNIISSLID